MSYQIYQTEGIILGKRNFGEANNLFFIYTEKFGRVDASAQGVRNLKSKLRYNLNLFSFGRFSLIKSRDFWKIIDAEEVISPFGIISSEKEFSLLVKIANLLDRMIKGEEKNESLWKEIKEFFIILNNKNLTKEDSENFEISTVLNILDNLGYIDRHQYRSKKTAVSAINKAIRESHL